MDKRKLTIGVGVLVAAAIAFIAGNRIGPLAFLGGATTPTGPAKAANPAPTAVPALCDQLLQAVKEKDADAAVALIDVPRMLQEMERQKILGNLTSSDRTSLLVALQNQLANGFVQEGESGGWKSCKIHTVEQKPGSNDAVVVLRMLTKDGTHSSLMRFYVVKEQDRWSLYDWEDVDRIFRTSTHIAMTLAAQQGQVRGNYLQAVLSAARFTGDGNDSVAERILSQLAGVDLGDILESTRWLLLARIKIGQGQPGDALKALDLAAKLNPDIPALSGLRAAAEQKAGNNEKAVDLAKQTLNRLGPDGRTYAVLGNALLAQGKQAEAVEAFRNGLANDPNLMDNVVGLARALPDDKKQEIGPVLAKMENAPAQFAVGADALLAAEDDAALAVLVAQFQKQFPNEAAGDYYRGELLFRKKDYAGAGKAFGEAASRLRNDAQRARVNRRLLDAWLVAGKPLEGYKAASDPGAAFEYLGDQLLAKKDEANLTELAQLHLEKVPTDPRGYYYRGQAHMLARRYTDAEKSFADGATRAGSDELREVFRSERVNARFKAGNGLSAYEEIKPQRATFDQLARLFLDAKQGDQLRALVAAHRKNVPDAPELDLWEAEAGVLKKDYPAAAKLFKAAADRSKDEDEKLVLSDRVLECWALAGNPVEGYRQSANADHAFGFLGDKLLEKKDGKSLAQLVEARRLKDPNDVRLFYYGGQAMLLEGKPADAEKLFIDGSKKADSEQASELFRQARIQALYKMGQGLKAYKEIIPPRQTFDILAHLYTDDKDADGLQNLTAAHFKADSEDPALGLWAAEVRWIRQDYKAAVDVLNSKRDAILKDEANRDRFEDRLIRSLARQKRMDEAMKAARQASARDGDPWYELVVHAASADVPKAKDLMEVCSARGYSPKDFHGDPDIGPALRSPAFADLLKQYPAPAEDAEKKVSRTSGGS